MFRSNVPAATRSLRFFSSITPLSTLLQHVAKGEQQEAEAILQKSPELGACRGSVKDYSFRYFKHISPFIYAVWALDWDMWTMILNYMPPAQVKIQLQELELYGTSYGRCFDFQQLISTQKVYLANFDTWSCKQLGIQWCSAIGIAQRNAVAHIAHHYCNPHQSFENPDFTSPLLTRSLRLVDGSQFFPLKHYPAGILGRDFAVFRWNKPFAGIGTMKPCPNARITSVTDLKALITLRDTRMSQLRDLKSAHGIVENSITSSPQV